MPPRRPRMSHTTGGSPPPEIQIALPDALVFNSGGASGSGSGSPSTSSMQHGPMSDDNSSFPALAPSMPNSPTLVASSPPQHSVPLSPLTNDSISSQQARRIHRQRDKQQQEGNSGGDSGSSPAVTPPTYHHPQFNDNNNDNDNQSPAVSASGGDDPFSDGSGSPLSPLQQQFASQQRPPPQQHFGSSNNNNPSGSVAKKRKKRHRRVSLVGSDEDTKMANPLSGGRGGHQQEQQQQHQLLSETDKKDYHFVETQTTSTSARLARWGCGLFALWLLTFIVAGAIILMSFSLTERSAVAAQCLQGHNCNELPSSADDTQALNSDLFVPTRVVRSFPRWCWKQCLALVATGKETRSSSGGNVVAPVVNRTASTAWYQLDSISVTVSRPAVSSRVYTLVANSSNNDPPRAASQSQTVIQLPLADDDDASSSSSSSSSSSGSFSSNSRAGSGEVVMKDAISPSVVSKITLRCELRFASSHLFSKLLSDAQLPQSQIRKTRLGAASGAPSLSVADALSDPALASCSAFAALVFDTADDTWCNPSSSRQAWIAVIVFLIIGAVLLIAAAIIAVVQHGDEERVFQSANAVVEEMTNCATIMNTGWGTHKYDSRDIDLSAVEVAAALIESNEGRILLARKVRAKKNLENLLSFVPRAVRNPAMRGLQERDLDDGAGSGAAAAAGESGGRPGGAGQSSSGDSDDNNDDPILMVGIPHYQNQQHYPQHGASLMVSIPQQPLPFLAVDGGGPTTTAASSSSSPVRQPPHDFSNAHLSTWDARVPTPNHPLSKVPSFDVRSGGASGIFSKEQFTAFQAQSSSGSASGRDLLLVPDIPHIGVTPDVSGGGGGGFGASSTVVGGLLAIPDSVASRRQSTSTHSSGEHSSSYGGSMRRASCVMDRRAASRLRRSATPFMGPQPDTASNAATINSNSAPGSLSGSDRIAPSGDNNNRWKGPQQQQQQQQQADKDFVHVRLAPGSVMRRRRCSALYCKIHFDSATLTPARLPAVSDLLDQFVFDISSTAEQYGGVVVEYGFGTALIQWNGFTPYGMHETQTCLCALALAGHFQAYEEHQRFYSDAENSRCCCDFGICVNTGIMTVGFCGTVGNLSMFCLGDPVSHLRHGVELGRLIGCRVLSLHETMKAANARILSVPVDVCSFDNGATKTTVHEVRGDGHMDASNAAAAAASGGGGSLTSFTMNKTTSAEEQAARPHFMKGFMYLAQSRYEDAQEHFQAAKDANGGDAQIDRLLQLCYTMAQREEMSNSNNNMGGGGGEDLYNQQQQERLRVEYVRLAPAWLFPEADLETMAMFDEDVAASLAQVTQTSDMRTLEVAIGSEGAAAINNAAGKESENQSPNNDNSAAAEDYSQLKNDSLAFNSSMADDTFNDSQKFNVSLTALGEPMIGASSSAAAASAAVIPSARVHRSPPQLHDNEAPMIQLFSNNSSNSSSAATTPPSTVQISKQQVQQQQQHHQHHNVRPVRQESEDSQQQHAADGGETVVMVVDSPSPQGSTTDYGRMLSHASDTFMAAVENNNNRGRISVGSSDRSSEIGGGNASILSPVAGASSATAPFPRHATSTPSMISPTTPETFGRSATTPQSGRDTAQGENTPRGLGTGTDNGGTGSNNNNMLGIRVNSFCSLPLPVLSTPHPLSPNLSAASMPPLQDTTQPHFPNSRRGTATMSQSPSGVIVAAMGDRPASGALLGSATPRGSTATMAGGDDTDEEGSGPHSPGVESTTAVAAADTAVFALLACDCEIPRFADRDGYLWTCGEAVSQRSSASFSVHTGVSVNDGSLAELNVFHLPPQLAVSSNNNSENDVTSPAAAESGGGGGGDRRTPNRGASAAEELLAEVRAANSVRHACIQALHSAALTPCNHLILIKEICGGGTLAELVVKFGGLGMTALRRFSQDIARGIVAFHAQRNSPHGAVDTKNILLSTDGNCKIVVTTSPSSSSSSGNINNSGRPSSSLLRSAIVRTATRTDEFCAPELVESDDATVAGDVWGYGIVLCYLYNGESPFQTALTAMEQGILDPRVSLRSHIGNGLCHPVNPVKSDGVGSLGNSSLSNINFGAGDETDEMLKSLIDQCLRRNPAKRCSFQQILGHPFFLF